MECSNIHFNDYFIYFFFDYKMILLNFIIYRKKYL